MNWEHAINAAERLGFAILLRNMDVELISLPVFNRTITIDSPEAALAAAERVAAQGGGIYYDPQNLLDAAVVNKMVVLG